MVQEKKAEVRPLALDQALGMVYPRAVTDLKRIFGEPSVALARDELHPHDIHLIWGDPSRPTADVILWGWKERTRQPEQIGWFGHMNVNWYGEDSQLAGWLQVKMILTDDGVMAEKVVQRPHNRINNGGDTNFLYLQGVGTNIVFGIPYVPEPLFGLETDSSMPLEEYLELYYRGITLRVDNRHGVGRGFVSAEPIRMAFHPYGAGERFKNWKGMMDSMPAWRPDQPSYGFRIFPVEGTGYWRSNIYIDVMHGMRNTKRWEVLFGTDEPKEDRASEYTLVSQMQTAGFGFPEGAQTVQFGSMAGEGAQELSIPAPVRLEIDSTDVRRIA